jgi:hypothetical protein
MSCVNVHHHIGGLEISRLQSQPPQRVHHHIGGLEICNILAGSATPTGTVGIFLSHLCGGEH